VADDTAAAQPKGLLDVIRTTQRIITLDIIFRALLGFIFVGMIVAANGMPKTSFGDPSAYPRFVGVIGLTLWVASNLNELVSQLRGKQQGRIYDITFQTTGMSPLVIWLRTGWVFGIMGATIVGVWLVNFHLAIPLFLFSYLRFVGKIKWWVAILIGALMELPIGFLYGALIHVVWPVSVLERVFDFSLQAPFDYLTRGLPF
jgi:hypothetical protein